MVPPPICPRTLRAWPSNSADPPKAVVFKNVRRVITARAPQSSCRARSGVAFGMNVITRRFRVDGNLFRVILFQFSGTAYRL